MRIEIIAIDFDGTIVTHQYPEVGRELPGAISTIKALCANGHNVFLYTMRDKEHLDDALCFLKSRGVVISGNISPAQFSTSPKQYASLYIDDAAACTPMCFNYGTGAFADMNCPSVDWMKIAEYLCKREMITTEQYKDIINDIHNTYRLKTEPYRPCE